MTLKIIIIVLRKRKIVIAHMLTKRKSVFFVLRMSSIVFTLSVAKFFVAISWHVILI